MDRVFLRVLDVFAFAFTFVKDLLFFKLLLLTLLRVALLGFFFNKALFSFFLATTATFETFFFKLDTLVGGFFLLPSKLFSGAFLADDFETDLYRTRGFATGFYCLAGFATGFWRGVLSGVYFGTLGSSITHFLS